MRSQTTNRELQTRSRGYMLITLMLALALITIALLTALPEISQQIKRDREEELRHRGTAYMRAIQHFYRKFGRYPSRLEELENTNNLRFIRKRYTDPMNVDRQTGKEKDFKLLHQMDIGLNNGPVLGQTPGQNGLPGQGGVPGQGAQGGLAGQLGGLQQAGNSGTQISGSGSSGDASSGSSPSGNPDAEGNSNQPGSSSSNSNTSSGSGFNGPTFGGGPILGVASLSKEKTIRVFYGKSHYNDWLFFYLPAADRGGLLTGPVNPGMQATGGLTPGVAGGTTGQGGFGQGLGQGLTPNGGQNQGFQTQVPQNPAPTPQQ